MSNKRFAVLQIGKEVTPFTAVAATARLMNLDSLPTISYDGQAEVLNDIAGIGPGSTAVFDGGMSTVKMSGVLSYQDLPYHLDALFGVATPTGAGPYVYAYAGQMLAPLPALRRNTFEFGDAATGGPNYKTVGGLLNKLSIETKPREPVKYTAEYLAGQVSTVTMAALSVRTQTPLHNSQVLVYMDAWGGTMGATQLTATAQEFKIDFDAKRAMQLMSGDLFPTDHDEDIIDVKFSGQFKFNATSKTLFEELISNAITQRQIRVKFTTGANAIAQFDLPLLMIPKIEMWGERNVTIMLTVEGSAMYHTTVANYVKASVTNQVATLP